MTFAAPWALALLVLYIPASIAYARWRERRRRRAIELLGDTRLLENLSSLPSAQTRRARAVVGLVGAACAILALARPQTGTGTRSVAGDGADLIFMLDLSRSMKATDVAPSRLAAAKAAARAIAAALPRDRVGLIVFAGDGFLQLPPTVDRSTFEAFLDAASPADVPDPATNLEAAAGVVANVIGGDSAYTGLVVLSDGEDNVGKLEGAIRTLDAAHVRAFAVGVGTPEGYRLDTSVTTRLVENNLGDIARRTGGVYARWAGPGSVEPVIAGLRALPPRTITGNARLAGTDRYQWPLALALLLMLLR